MALISIGHRLLGFKLLAKGEKGGQLVHSHAATNPVNDVQKTCGGEPLVLFDTLNKEYVYSVCRGHLIQSTNEHKETIKKSHNMAYPMEVLST